MKTRKPFDGPKKRFGGDSRPRAPFKNRENGEWKSERSGHDKPRPRSDSRDDRPKRFDRSEGSKRPFEKKPFERRGRSDDEGHRSKRPYEGRARSADSDTDRKPRPYGDRKDKPFEKKPFKGNDRAPRDGDRKPWDKDRKPKSYGDRTKKPFEKKPYEKRERSTSMDKGDDKPWESSDRKPRSSFGDRDRQPRGKFRDDRPKRSFDKKPYDKKPFEKKPFEKKPRESFPGARPNLYGFHAVRAAWLNGDRTVEALYLTDTSAEGFAATLDEAAALGLDRPPPMILEKHVLEAGLQAGAVHQGVALAAAPLEEIGLDDLMIRGAVSKRNVLLVLDQITDPQNVGAILRSACAFGASGVVMQTVHAPDLTGALAKTATGAIEHVPVAYETNLSRVLERLKEEGYFICGLDERGEKTVADIEKTGKIALVLGAEGEGLRRLIRENCDMLVRLPTSGPIQSLNVSNAAAVSLFALMN